MAKQRNQPCASTAMLHVGIGALQANVANDNADKWWSQSEADNKGRKPLLL